MLRRKQKAQGTVEYSLLLSLIAVVLIVILTVMGGSLSSTFFRVVCGLSGQACWGGSGGSPLVTGGPAITVPFKFSSVDLMKATRDTDGNQWSQAQIDNAVAVAAQIGSTHLTVDGYWEFPDYAQKWANSIRAHGKHVWFRMQAVQWNNNMGVGGIMTPSQYLAGESAFILAHPGLFQSSDVWDSLSEPENGSYWAATYPGCLTCTAPNAYTNEFNQFILDGTNTANAAFATLGISGITTGIRSTNSYYASHPEALYNSTIAALGYVASDSYPEGTLTNPAAAAFARMLDLQAVQAAHPTTPIVIGEMGYSNWMFVNDATQDSVLQAEFAALRPITYIAAINYWVGPGSSGAGGFTNVMTNTGGGWVLRPAALSLASFYLYEHTKP